MLYEWIIRRKQVNQVYKTIERRERLSDTQWHPTPVLLPGIEFAWKIPWTEEPGRLQSMGSLRIRHD